MSTTHIVQQGECLSSIAADNGFADYRTIYNAPENADFRAKRPNPNLIYPGDSIVIPDRATKSASISTGTTNKIIVNGTSRTLCLAVRDPDGNAVSYRLEVDGVEVDGVAVSGVDGALQYTVAASATAANVCIDDAVIPLQIAALNLLSADAPDGGISGAQARLANLGYDVPNVSGVLDDATTGALAQFQTDQGLTVSSELDDATRAQLAQVYGC